MNTETLLKNNLRASYSCSYYRGRELLVDSNLAHSDSGDCLPESRQRSGGYLLEKPLF